jgi:hypothetical protein
MEFVLFYLICVFAVGFIASQRGRSGVGWFLLALLISPLIAVIVLALIPSRSPSATSLESQVRDKLLESRFAHNIRAHKPAFCNSMVYDVELGGERRRFRSKAEALAFCMSRSQSDGPPQQLPRF